MGESTCRSTRTKKAQHKHRCELGCHIQNWTPMNRTANETNQNDYLQNDCGFFLFFPIWICLMNIEPPLFIFAKTEQRTVLQLFSLESGLVGEYAIVSVSSHSTFIISLLDRMTLTKSSTKVTNVESAFTVTNTYKKYY